MLLASLILCNELLLGSQGACSKYFVGRGAKVSVVRLNYERFFFSIEKFFTMDLR